MLDFDIFRTWTTGRLVFNRAQNYYALDKHSNYMRNIMTFSSS